MDRRHNTSRHPVLGPRYAVLGTATLLMASATLSYCGQRPLFLVVSIAAAFIPYSLLLLGPAPSIRETLLGVLLGFLIGVAMLPAEPVLSDDVYRYVWDARVALQGIDPYAYPPSDPALFSLRDALYPSINHPDIPTIYPPFAQLLFQGAYALTGSIWGIKSLALVGLILSGIGTWWLVRGGEGRRAALLCVLNPLALTESAISGHIDSALGFAVICFTWALATGRGLGMTVAAAAASGIKLLGIVLAPLAWRSGKRWVLPAIGLSLLSLLPLLRAGAGAETTSGVSHFVQRWQGNDGPYRVLEEVVHGALHVTGTALGDAPGTVDLEPLAPLVSLLKPIPLNVGQGLRTPKKPREHDYRFSARALARTLTRTLVALVVVVLVLATAKSLRSKTVSEAQADLSLLGPRNGGTKTLRRYFERHPAEQSERSVDREHTTLRPDRACRVEEAITRTRWIVWPALLLSPQVHPWYLLWILPLECADKRRPFLVWSCAVLLAYMPLEQWMFTRRWENPVWLLLLEYLFVASAVAVSVGRQGLLRLCGHCA
ncbi:MAG: glycosyltransferase family 87 protein [Myxococcota bacterium]